MSSPTRALLDEARSLGGIAAAVSSTMLAQLALSVVETLVVSRLGAPALAGVALAAGLELLVFLLCLGVVTALIPLVSTALGRGDLAAARASTGAGFLVALATSLPAALVLLLLRAPIAALAEPGLAAESAAAYLTGSAVGLPAWVLFVAFRSVAVAAGASRTTVLAMTLVVPLHAALCLGLTLGGPGLLALGAFGAGVARALAGGLALAFVAFALRRSPHGSCRAVLRPLSRPTGAAIHDLLRLGVPFAARILLREGVMPAAAFLVAPHGTAAVAAHALASRLVDLLGITSFGLSSAATVRVARAVGLGDGAAVARAAWVSLGLALLVGLATGLPLAFLPGTVASLLLGDDTPEDLAALASLLPLAALLLLLEGVLSAVGGALSGFRDARAPFVIVAVGSWAVGLPLGYLLTAATARPADGLWCGMAIGAVLTAALYLARLLRHLSTHRTRAG
ncbi:MATE family efflux transporter [Sabulicella glaciei]|uniref:MATE family efflux transporter n=1 Tax=Sabulicella glaciei TaxID=2984948 RepID=A0ABT3NZK7_9PROT|nr:MATE family efflux transporter [Roseococcus sp. MDT2-1-1]MCW8087595.1 MATE family efflux transporter [Roseococcus sp. MDT2-1-1]